MQNFSDEHLPVIEGAITVPTHGGAEGFVDAADIAAVALRWLAGTIISGNGSRPNDDIEKVTGRPPITFEDFARWNAHAWTLQSSTRSDGPHRDDLREWLPRGVPPPSNRDRGLEGTKREHEGTQGKPGPTSTGRRTRPHGCEIAVLI